MQEENFSPEQSLSVIQSMIEKAKNAHHKIKLIDGSRLVDLMHEYNVGVQIKSTLEIKQLDEDFFI